MDLQYTSLETFGHTSTYQAIFIFVFNNAKQLSSFDRGNHINLLGLTHFPDMSFHEKLAGHPPAKTAKRAAIL